MARPTDPATAPPGRDRTPKRAAKVTLVVAVNGLGVWGLFGHVLGSLALGLLLLLLALGTYLLAYRWGLVHDRAFLAAWIGVAVVASVFSLVVGPLNGLTDEPYVMPVLAGAWPNLYGSTLSVTYVQYGRTFTEAPLYNVYLPFLPYLRLPFVNYKWTSLGAWMASLYLLRRRDEALTLWGGFWVGLMAANGFNDYVPFLFLTLAFVRPTGPWAKVAEYVGLGLKQFANVVIVGVHLYRRQWRDAAIAVGVTAAILAPFAYLSPGGVWCHAILIESTNCGGNPGPVFGAAVLSHVNYPLWLLYVAAVFGAGYVRGLRAAPSGGWRGRAGELVRRYFPERPRPSPALGSRGEAVAEQALLEVGRRPDEEGLEVDRVRAVVADEPVE